LISIDRGDAQRLNDLIGALMAQVPPRANGAAMMRGDLRSHVEKAQEIARELLPPGANATDAAGKSATSRSGQLVTVDRTSLERLDVELDAIELILPRMTRKTS
jgi:hypothetical protein